MNLAIIEGGVVKDPELKFTQKGTASVKFKVAASTGYGDKKETDYIECQAWGKTAEYIANHAVKGTQVRVQGKIQTGSYEGKNGKVYFTQVLVSMFDGFKIISGGNSGQAPQQGGGVPSDYFGENYTEVDDSADMPF